MIAKNSNNGYFNVTINRTYSHLTVCSIDTNQNVNDKLQYWNQRRNAYDKLTELIHIMSGEREGEREGEEGGREREGGEEKRKRDREREEITCMI